MRRRTGRASGGIGSPEGWSRPCERHRIKLSSLPCQGEVCNCDTSSHYDFRINHFIFDYVVMYSCIDDTVTSTCTLTDCCINMRVEQSHMYFRCVRALARFIHLCLHSCLRACGHMFKCCRCKHNMLTHTLSDDPLMRLKIQGIRTKQVRSLSVCDNEAPIPIIFRIDNRRLSFVCCIDVATCERTCRHTCTERCTHSHCKCSLVRVSLCVFKHSCVVKHTFCIQAIRPATAAHDLLN